MHQLAYHTRLMSIIFVVVLTCFFSCRKKTVKERVDAVTDRAAIPVLAADSVTTLISDSGVVQYRIKTKRWEIYDKATPPYWEFPEGIYLDKFNEQMDVQASLQADYAHYNSLDQIWELRGNVVAVNLEGERFETPQLFWNQKTERVFSDSVIHITRETSIITGVGFESNQNMSKYTILHPTGVFPIDEE